MNTALLKHASIINIINNIVQLNDDVVVGAGLAALFLGVSQKTLSRYRQNGTSPPYSQYPATNSKARNQKVYYEMRDLRVWREKYKVLSTMDAAATRGMSFTTLSDVTIAQPFWISKDIIIDHALDSTAEIFTQRLKNSENSIIWLNWQNVLENTWQSAEIKNKFLNPYSSLLTKLLGKVNS